MIERREHFGLALEAREAIRIRRQRRRQDFDRHLTLQLRIGGAVDLSHAAYAEQSDDFIRAEACAGCQRQ